MCFWRFYSSFREICQKLSNAQRLSFWRFYFSFKGRISRSQFWLKGIPFCILFSGAVIVVPLTTFDKLKVDVDSLSVFMMIALWPFFAVAVKRLHDRNKSVWYPLKIFSYTDRLSTFEYLVFRLFFLPFLLMYVVIMWYWSFFIEVPFLKGTYGSNRFGPDPLKTDERTQPI